MLLCLFNDVRRARELSSAPSACDGLLFKGSSGVASLGAVLVETVLKPARPGLERYAAMFALTVHRSGLQCPRTGP
jgi:hypothetical protein